MPARNISLLQRDEPVLTLAWSMLSLAEFILRLDLTVLYSVEAVIYMREDTMYTRKIGFFSVNFYQILSISIKSYQKFIGGYVACYVCTVRSREENIKSKKNGYKI